jgi:nucleoid-associated protein Lsr2
MARSYVAVIKDDLTGEVIEDGQAVTIEFSIDGRAYTIDLGPENAEAFHAALEKFVAAATRVGGSTRGRRNSTRTTQDLAAIRAWANDHGYVVAARGRISSEIKEAFEKAH